MSNFWQKERNETAMGDPSRKEKMKGVKSDPFFKKEPRASNGASMAEGMPAGQPEKWPVFDKGNKNFQWQDRSVPKKGKI